MLVDDVFCVRGDCIVVCFGPLRDASHAMAARSEPNGDSVMDSVVTSPRSLEENLMCMSGALDV